MTTPQRHAEYQAWRFFDPDRLLDGRFIAIATGVTFLEFQSSLSSVVGEGGGAMLPITST